VTQLRKAMLEEFQRRNMSPITTRIYLRCIEEFARYFRKSPDQLGPEQIREYQAYLFTDRKLGAIAVTQHLSVPPAPGALPSYSRFSTRTVHWRAQDLLRTGMKPEHLVPAQCRILLLLNSRWHNLRRCPCPYSLETMST